MQQIGSWKKKLSSKVNLLDNNKDKDLPEVPGSTQQSTFSSGLQERFEDYGRAIAEMERSITDKERVITDKKQIITDQMATIKHMQEEEELLQGQIWKFSDQLNGSKGEADTLRAQLDQLNSICDEQMQDLSARSNTIRVLSTHNQQLQKRVVSLEEFVNTACRESGAGLPSINHYLELKEAHKEMAAKLKSEEESRSNLCEAVQAIESENATLKTVIGELQKEASTLEISRPLTLRSLLIMKLVDRASAVQSIDDSAETDGDIQNWLPIGLPENSLDKICTPVEIENLASILPKGRAYNQFYERIRLEFCHVCSKPKFQVRLDPQCNTKPVKWLNEFLSQSRYFSCCYERVCRDCFKNFVIDTLESKWWYKLGMLQWFPCPRDGCDEILGIRCEADLQVCLERSCDMEVEDYVKK